MKISLDSRIQILFAKVCKNDLVQKNDTYFWPFFNLIHLIRLLKFEIIIHATIYNL